MKKVYEFIKKHGLEICVVIAAAALILSFFLPLMVGIGRYFWHVAFSDLVLP